MEVKLKDKLAMDRFLSRGGGLVSCTGDAVLEAFDLNSVKPVHYLRTRFVQQQSSPKQAPACPSSLQDLLGLRFSAPEENMCQSGRGSSVLCFHPQPLPIALCLDPIIIKTGSKQAMPFCRCSTQSAGAFFSDAPQLVPAV